MAKFKHQYKAHTKPPTQEELDEDKELKRRCGYLRRKNEGKR